MVWITRENRYFNTYHLVNEDEKGKNHDGGSPFQFTARGGNLGVVTFTFENVDDKNPFGWLTIESRNLLSQHENVSKKNNKNDRCDDPTLLLKAAQLGNLEIFKFIFEKVDYESQHFRSKSGRTPLYEAAIKGHLEIVKFICANVNFHFKI